MINDQLVEHIKKEKGGGLDNDKIVNNLLSAGWKREDVYAGFAAAGIPLLRAKEINAPSEVPNNTEIIENSASFIPETNTVQDPASQSLSDTNKFSDPFLDTVSTVSPRNNKAPSLLILLLILILLSVGGYFAYTRYFKQMAPETENNSTPTESPTPIEEPLPTPETSINTPTTASTPIPLASLDCKDNDQCFIQASADCKPSKLTSIDTFNILGVTQKTTSYMEIRGLENSLCLFYIRTQDISLTFPSGTSQETIDQQNKIYSALVGRDGVCKFKTPDLTAMLTRWSGGTFDGINLSCSLTPNGSDCESVSGDGDFSVAQCQGSYFETD